MRGKFWLTLTAVSALAVTAAAEILATSTDAVGSDFVTVVSADAAKTSQFLTQAVSPVSCTLGAPCIGSTGSTSSPGRCNFADNPLLRDLVYFGNLWNFLQKNSADEPIFVSGGYANARVVRDEDGTFFAGVVDKLDASGNVTDVIIAYTGANTADDFASAAAFIAGVDTPQLEKAVGVYEGVLHDGRYANARIHITGFSLGAGLTEYMLAYTLATYGAAFSDSRVTYDAFGVPGWAQGASNRYGVPLSAFNGRFNAYDPINDVVHLLGNSRMGTEHNLPPYKPVGLLPGAVANDVLAHTPYPYMSAIGLPSWLGDRQSSIVAQVQQAQALPPDPTYGSPGNVPVQLIADAASNSLVGSAASDEIRGGEGADIICGGAGADRFTYTAPTDSGSTAATADKILDFQEAEGDVLDLSKLAYALKIERFTYIGSSSFTGARQVRSYKQNDETWVEINWTGASTVNMLIRIAGQPTIDANGFALSQYGGR